MLFSPVGALASLGLEGLDRVTGFFHRARHEPAAHKEKSPPRPEPGRAEGKAWEAATC